VEEQLFLIVMPLREDWLAQAEAQEEGQEEEAERKQLGLGRN
jgi:hypothetical protein